MFLQPFKIVPNLMPLPQQHFLTSLQPTTLEHIKIDQSHNSSAVHHALFTKPFRPLCRYQGGNVLYIFICTSQPLIKIKFLSTTKPSCLFSFTASVSASPRSKHNWISLWYNLASLCVRNRFSGRCWMYSTTGHHRADKTNRKK